MKNPAAVALGRLGGKSKSPAKIAAAKENGAKSAETSKRFWSYVRKTETCWLWQGSKATVGYGLFRPSSDRRIVAHRFAYQDKVGKIPEDYIVDHLCRTRLCVRPSHLEAVTSQTNNLRSAPYNPRNKNTQLRRHSYYKRQFERGEDKQAL